MQMKTEQYQERCFNSLRCENCGDCHDNYNEAQIMAKCMMIIAPPIQRMTGVARQPVNNNPQPVEIRDNTRPRHQCAVAFAERRRRVGDSPAHEEMRDRAHCLRLSDYSGWLFSATDKNRTGNTELSRHLEPEAGLEPATTPVTGDNPILHLLRWLPSALSHLSYTLMG